MSVSIRRSVVDLKQIKNLIFKRQYRKERWSFANKKGRDLSQNLSLVIESLPDPVCHYYSYLLQYLKKVSWGRDYKLWSYLLLPLPSRCA